MTALPPSLEFLGVTAVVTIESTHQLSHYFQKELPEF